MPLVSAVIAANVTTRTGTDSGEAGMVGNANVADQRIPAIATCHLRDEILRLSNVVYFEPVSLVGAPGTQTRVYVRRSPPMTSFAPTAALSRSRASGRVGAGGLARHRNLIRFPA
jgi:hypothetical protein